MGTSRRMFSWAVVSLGFLSLLSNISFGQRISQPFITQPIVDSKLVTLRGNTHPLAQPQFDIGAAAPDMAMQRMLLVLKRSPEQEYALRTFLDDQQDKLSSQYHKWLTPNEFGTQFGPADQDLQQITGWLQLHGFQVNRVSQGRTAIEFSGTEGQVEEALHTSIHKYAVNGEEHWANATDPQIPAALAPAVAGIASLNNFPRHPAHAYAGSFVRDKATGKITRLSPQFSFPETDCTEVSFCFALGPYDFATIYNVLPLWNNSVNGTGQTIAIVGETNINPSDVADFRSLFDLPANSVANGNPLNIIVDGPDPGINGDEPEADIDVQWSGAVAPYATIDFVTSESTETTAGIDLSALYIIDNNLAPIMSESYGLCELGLGTAGNQFYNALWEQAAGQGITVFVSTGDSGSAGCDVFQGQVPQPALYGLGVNGIASTPFNVAVGGTDFNDLNNPTTYWNELNDSTTEASAKSYIPESTWNDSCTNALWAQVGYSSSAQTNCNSASLAGAVITAGGNGGVSNCTSNQQALGSCSGGYAKPSWQAAPGVPSDGHRDLPDVSLFASNGFLGSFYIICQSDATPGPCDLNSGYFEGYGGTSVASPALAGMMALVNQHMAQVNSNPNTRQGNANYVFYKLAGKQSASSCNSSAPASTCVFNDVTVGTIAMPCKAGSPNCSTSGANSVGILSGYQAGTGYDLATGLGTVNANNLVNQWSSVSFTATTTTLGLSPTSSLTHGQSVTVNGTVAPSSGSGTPSGDVTLLTSTGAGVDGFTLSGGKISGNTDLLPGGTYTVTAHYAGDSIFGGSDSAPVSITVGKENSTPQLQLVTFGWNGSLTSSNASTAVYGSPYILRVNVLNSSGGVCEPNPVGESACPTGSVSLTDNGSALDGGTFALNSAGYTEDESVQLPGGSRSVKASYAGDNSFNASLATTTYSITPAATSMSEPNACCAAVDGSFSATVTVQAQSTGIGPTGTVTFLANGSPISGTVTYEPTAATASNPVASLYASLTSSSAFSSAGNYTITATYSGDANYGSSVSGATNVAVKYPTPLLSMSPSNITVAAGSSVTVSALIDTFLKNAPTPTGTVPFVYWGPMTPVSGTETYTPTTDSNGNVEMQASITFVPTANVSIAASYNGDSNYPAAAGGGLTNITVTGSDFSLIPSTSSLPVTPGGSGSVQIYVEGQSSYTGTMTFTSNSCAGLPNESTCSFSPGIVVGTGSTTLTINTAPPHSAADNRNRSPRELLALSFSMPLAALCLIGVPRRRKWRILPSLFVLTILFIAVGCGGSGSGGGGGGGGNGKTDPGTPAGSYTITVTGTSGSGSSAVTHTTSFTLVVQ